MTDFTKPEAIDTVNFTESTLTPENASAAIDPFAGPEDPDDDARGEDPIPDYNPDALALYPPAEIVDFVPDQGALVPDWESVQA